MEFKDRNITYDLDSVVIQFLRNIKNIVDRAYFHPYYKKSDFKENIRSIDKLIPTPPKTYFTFIHTKDRLDQAFTSDEVLQIFKFSKILQLVDKCIEIYCLYSEIMFLTHNHVSETYAIETMGKDVARCILVLQRSNYFDTHSIQEHTKKYIRYMMKTIASIDSANCKYDITICHEMSVLILHFKNVNTVESCVLEQLLTMFSKFLLFLERGQKLSAWHSESFAILLNILYEVIENSTLAAISDTILARMFTKVFPVLDGLLKHFPDYIQEVIQNCLYLLASITT